MLLRSIGALLLTLGAAHGFKDTSPFFALSTRPLGELRSAVMATAEDTTNALVAQYNLDMLVAEMNDRTPSRYIIFSQPGLTNADLQDDRVLPKMKALASHDGYMGRVEISNIFGELDGKSLAKEMGLDAASVERSLVRGQPLPTDKNARAKALSSLDEQIAAQLPDTSADHALILISSPDAESDLTPEHLYEMDEPYPSAMHQDLKRHMDLTPRQSSSNGSNMQDGLPLFEKYQFLTPGLFMGLTVSLLLVIMLWVGVSAIAGLEVSYKAFSKEMGPQAQNKGKQQ